MVGIRTNAASMAAQAALQTLGAQKTRVMAALSTGLRVADSSDNAAYWSIATTMRSDVGMHRAALDSLGLAGAQVDTAFKAIDQARAVLDRIKSHLVAAHQPAVDQEKIQTEIRQLALQAVAIARSATSNGVNFLSTDVFDILEAELPDRSAPLLGGAHRTNGGNLAFATIDLDLRDTSLINADGGGILQRDPRSPGTIGNIRTLREVEGITVPSNGNARSGAHPAVAPHFPGPITFSNPGDQISFDLTVDEDNPAHGILAPFHPGRSSSVVVTRAHVDVALPGANGVIADGTAFASVLNVALASTGASAGPYEYRDGTFDPPRMVVDPARYIVQSNGGSGLPGAFLRIDNFTSNVGPTGLGNVAVPGARSSTIGLEVVPFKIYKDVVVDFNFYVPGHISTTHRIDRALVDRVLGPTNGWIRTPADMQAILEDLIGDPRLEITTNAGIVTVASRPEFDRRAGANSGIGFSGVRVNIEPIPETGILDIDIARHPARLHLYLHAVDTMLERLTDGATALGATKRRITSTTEVTQSLIQAQERGLGQLIDADMEHVSTRLKALQVQEQLATQALAIANAAPSRFAELFKGLGG